MWRISDMWRILDFLLYTTVSLFVKILHTQPDILIFKIIQSSDNKDSILLLKIYLMQ